MILPGLVSIAFYRRRPTLLQVLLGLAFTVVVSGLLGYWQDFGTSRVWENTVIAIIGGVVLYLAVLAILLYWYFPRQSTLAEPSAPSAAPPRS